MSDLMMTEKRFREYVEDNKVFGRLERFAAHLEEAMLRLPKGFYTNWSLSVEEIDDESPVQSITVNIKSEIDIKELY